MMKIPCSLLVVLQFPLHCQDHTDTRVYFIIIRVMQFSVYYSVAHLINRIKNRYFIREKNKKNGKYSMNLLLFNCTLYGNSMEKDKVK